MNKDILNTGIQEYINNNLNTDIMSVVLKKSTFPQVTSKELAEQIESKKRCIKKLPTWFNKTGVYYPNKLNIEQCSSETTAQYKSQIVNGKSLIDLTGGFGIDSYYFSKTIDEISHCEINQKLSQIASHNFEQLGAKNIETHCESGIGFLTKANKKFDWIYVDPSRRDDVKGKVFQLADCTPNIQEHLVLFFKKASNILIKTSPLLDLSLGIDQLHYVKEIHIVAVNNEVKELLWVLNQSYQGDLKIQTINLKKNAQDSYGFNRINEQKAIAQIGLPQDFIYEPNAAILKAGAFKTIARDYGLLKLHEHTHLYTSDHLIEFPGRVFKITKVEPFSTKILKTLSNSKANVSTRNFPMSVSEIRKKYKLKDGGGTYLFFAKNCINELIVVFCKKYN